MNQVGYLYDERYLLHDPGTRHIESPRRLLAISEALSSFGATERWQKIEPRPARMDELLLVHHSSLTERVEWASNHAPAHLDADTVVSSESFRTALFAAGGVLECVDAVCVGRLRRAFAFVRPPGHHAGPERAMGFCLFNNVALAAAYARLKYRFERLAIIDNDVHHGNGTQAIFYDQPHVLYISSHQFPFYPGTGSVSEIGEKEGKSFNLNFPLPAGTGDATFVSIYSKVVRPVLEQYRPELILVSAGFDAHYRDPVGGLKITEAGYASSAASLILAAEQCCQGRICFVLEGGYDQEALQLCARAVMTEMEEDSPRELEPTESVLFRQIARAVKKAAGDLWQW